ncbi:MAG: aminotransferase class V-fold PLP-dependent enzyme, partial [Pseudomonadota bacterium]
MRIYLDHNATTALRPEAKAAAEAAMALTGNASSIHMEGRAARALIEDARASVAAVVGGQPKNIFFTSGGSEAAATLLAPGFSYASTKPATRLIISSIEHSCVLSGGRFSFEKVARAPVTADGIIDIA